MVKPIPCPEMYLGLDNIRPLKCLFEAIKLHVKWILNLDDLRGAIDDDKIKLGLSNLRIFYQFDLV